MALHIQNFTIKTHWCSTIVTGIIGIEPFTFPHSLIAWLRDAKETHAISIMSPVSQPQKHWQAQWLMLSQPKHSYSNQWTSHTPHL